MEELFGDATRCGDWASVRLRVDGDRILDADADGLAEDLRGLSLLEAAAVPGDELVTDALAAAIGPAFRAPRSPSRVAVAMSGGVDSAVTLLRSGPDAIGVTLRLWVDPEPAGACALHAMALRSSASRCRAMVARSTSRQVIAMLPKSSPVRAHASPS